MSHWSAETFSSNFVPTWASSALISSSLAFIALSVSVIFASSALVVSIPSLPQTKFMTFPAAQFRRKFTGSHASLAAELAVAVTDAGLRAESAAQEKKLPGRGPAHCCGAAPDRASGSTTQRFPSA
ncbi:MAG: hypothetical protein WCP28_04465 [Actinomycetes bacterium]